jgi:uncharacterized protein
MRKWIRIGAGLMLAGCMGQAFAAPPSVQQVRDLMDAFGMGSMMTQMSIQMTAVMQKQLPCVPATYWQDFADANSTDQLISRMIPAYQKHFSAEDIDELVKFYRSPLGQKVISQMPATMSEAMEAGQQWGEDRRTQMIGSLKSDGTLNTQGQCPAAPAPAAAPKTTKKKKK